MELEPMKWECLIIAPDQLTAEMWLEFLRNEGIIAMLQPKDAISFMGLSAMPCRIMVPQDLLSKAKVILNEYLE
jgi:hypothetical protein